MNVATPVVFDFKGRDLIVSSTSDGRLFIVDDKSFGGEDHKTPLSQTAPVAAPGGGIWGGLASWKDSGGALWVYAPVWGKLNPDLNPAKSNGPVSNGAIVAFKVEEQDGKPVLTPSWVSRDMRSPVPPVTTSGAVFALSPGSYASDGRLKGASHATLYGLDAQTGEEIYSSGSQVMGPGDSHRPDRLEWPCVFRNRRRHSVRIRRSLGNIVVMLFRLAACLTLVLIPALADDAKAPLPDGPGKETTVKICGKCHGVDVAVSRRETADGWNAIVLQMIKRGAKGTDDQFGEIVDYLAEHFPKTQDAPRIAVNTASAKDLETGLEITEKEASAIVQYRGEKGPFKTFDDLLKVPGVDAAKLEAKKTRLDY